MCTIFIKDSLYLKLHSGTFSDSKSVDHKMVIHILGAEKEADFGISFLV